MLDPRVYRAAFIPAAFALIVAAFSLLEPPRGSSTSLAPDAFVGARAFAGPGTGLQPLAGAYPQRRPGSAGDTGVADRVIGAFRTAGFETIIRRFSANTPVGRRRMRDVIGVRPGVSNRRIVVLAHRDSLHSPATADLSGTAALAELARVFTGRTLRKTLVLVSTSGGSGGNAGAAAWARAPGGPVDAVVVLGDLASPRVRGPLIVRWSNALGVAPVGLERTVAQSLGLETGRRVPQAGLASQFARLAVPLTLSEQGEVQAHGLPAVLLTVAGERGPGASAAVSQDRLQEMGRTVLRTISALDGRTEPISGPRAEVFLSRKLVPAWAIRLVVGTVDFLGAAIGLQGPAVARGWWDLTFRGELPYYFIFLAVLVILLFITWLLQRSRFGYYLRAIKAGERAARSLGVPVRRTKLYALMLSATFTSVAGSLYAIKTGFIDPESGFGILVSVQMVIIAALGGAGTLYGPLVGAIILIPLQTATNTWFGGGGTGLTYILYGGIIVIIARFEPGGLHEMWQRIAPKFGKRHAA